MVQSYVLDIFYIQSISAASLLINPADLKVIKQDVRRTYRGRCANMNYHPMYLFTYFVLQRCGCGQCSFSSHSAPPTGKCGMRTPASLVAWSTRQLSLAQLPLSYGAGPNSRHTYTRSTVPNNQPTKLNNCYRHNQVNSTDNTTFNLTWLLPRRHHPVCVFDLSRHLTVYTR